MRLRERDAQRHDAIQGDQCPDEQFNATKTPNEDILHYPATAGQEGRYENIYGPDVDVSVMRACHQGDTDAVLTVECVLRRVYVRHRQGLGSYSVRHRCIRRCWGISQTASPRSVLERRPCLPSPSTSRNHQVPASPYDGSSSASSIIQHAGCVLVHGRTGPAPQCEQRLRAESARGAAIAAHIQVAPHLTSFAVLLCIGGAVPTWDASSIARLTYDQ